MQSSRRKSKKRYYAVPLLAALTGPTDCGDKKLLKKIINRYFELVEDRVIDESGEWSIPGFMDICVYRKDVRNSNFRHPITGEVKINLRRPNERNTITATGKLLDERKFRFVPSQRMQARLKNILENTNQEFRYPPKR